MRDSVSAKLMTYGFLALFVFMVARASVLDGDHCHLKPIRSSTKTSVTFPRQLTLENFVRVIVREELLTNIRNSFTVAMSTTLFTVVGQRHGGI